VALQGLGGGAARGGVERGEQAERGRRQVAEPFGHGRLVHLGKAGRRGQLLLPPVVIRRRPAQAEDLVQLLDLNEGRKKERLDYLTSVLLGMRGLPKNISVRRQPALQRSMPTP
jgi:hypothetical protein